MSSDNDIRKQFQEKLGNLKAEVPVDGWTRLEEALNAVPPVASKPRFVWRYVASAAAAVLLLIVGSLLFMQRPTDLPQPMISDATAPQSPRDEYTISDKTTDHHTAEAGVYGTKSHEITPRKRASSLLVAEKRSDVVIEDISPVHPRELETFASLENRVEADATLIDGHEEGHREGSYHPYAREEEQVVASTGREGMLAGYAPDRNREPILLAVSGRGGLTSYQQMVNTPMTLRTASAAESLTEEAKQNLFASRSSTDNISEMEHDQPVSFGITVSKAIVDDLYIETGLVYSYLHSKVRNASSNFEVQETQRFHYLGIPLNVNYNVFTLNRLNVYASVGGMIEKDIYGRLRDERESSTVEENNKAGALREQHISQRNPQISVNAGVGVSYPLYDQLKLYGKIGGSYYFDANNEHKTIYSDRKIVMDLSLGIRYEFK